MSYLNRSPACRERYTGVVRPQIAYAQPFKCPACDGFGSRSMPYSRYMPCPACNGKGVLWSIPVEVDWSKTSCGCTSSDTENRGQQDA